MLFQALVQFKLALPKQAISWDNALLITFHEGNVSHEEKQVLDLAVSSGEDVILLPDSKAFTPKDIASYLIDGWRRQGNICC